MYGTISDELKVLVYKNAFTKNQQKMFLEIRVLANQKLHLRKSFRTVLFFLLQI